MRVRSSAFVPLIASIAGILFIFAGFLWLTAPQGGLYVSGQVIAASETAFIIRDNSGVETEIIIDEKTITKRGRESLFIVPPVGSHVIVSGLSTEAGRIHARIIRLFEAGKGKRAMPAR